MPSQNEELEIVPEDDNWEPKNYKQPTEDEVIIRGEHPHPLSEDQSPKGA